MEKAKELRMTLMILLVGMFLLTGCFFSKKYTIEFKSNGGSSVEALTIKSGNTIEEPDTPSKDGYVFLGWYLDDEEFDFDTEVNEDMTLVAKWSEVTSDETLEDDEEATTTVKTTNAVTTKNTNTTINNNSGTTITSTSKTTTVRTTKATTVPTTTKGTVVVTTQATTVAMSTSTQTTTTTQVVTQPVTQPVTTTVPVNLTFEVIEDDVETEEIDESAVNLIMSVKSDKTSNVINNLDEIDYNEFINSNITTWTYYTNKGELINTPTMDQNGASTIKFESAIDVNAITVNIGTTSYIISTLDDGLNWMIDYPSVSVGEGINIKYYNDINVAIEFAQKGDTVTLLNNNLIVSSNIIIDKAIIINGDSHSIISTGEYLFEIKDIDDELANIQIKGINDATCKSVLLVNSGVNLNEIGLDNNKFNYTVDKVINNSTTTVEDSTTIYSGKL